jgi:hypothetical protein
MNEEKAFKALNIKTMDTIHVDKGNERIIINDEVVYANNTIHLNKWNEEQTKAILYLLEFCLVKGLDVNIKTI